MESRQLNIHQGESPKQPGTIRFVCISDTHNKTTNLKVPEGDVLLHSGDFSNIGNDKDIVHFNNFLSTLPHPHKVVIAGNHDLSFDLENNASLKLNFGNLHSLNAAETKAKLTNCIYLEDSGINLLGYNIYGSPWTPTFFDWAFNLDRGENIRKKWELIPPNTDLLLTHGPPHRILDTCSDGFHAGCEELVKKIEEIKPLVHLFGHIHEAYGTIFDGYTNYINASICTLRYHPSNRPYVFDLPIRN